MARRYYSSTAVATTLSASANNSTTSITVTALSGYPVSTPWTAIIDPDTASEEVVSVTGVSGTTLTVTRGVDGTTAVSHSAGAVFRHGVSGRDFDEANEHVNDSTNDVHSQYVTKSLINDAGKGALASTTGTAVAALAVGSNGTYLKANSSTTTGLEWATPTASDVGAAASTNAVILTSAEVQNNASQAAIRALSGATNSVLILRRANGTLASPTIVNDNDLLGSVNFQGWDGSAYRSAAQIQGGVAGATGASDMPGRLLFLTSADSSVSPTECMRINAEQELLIGYTADNGSYKLQVNSQIFATSATVATSDGRYKENVSSLEGMAALVRQLNPVEFTWKPQQPILGPDGEVIREAHNFPTGTQVGFIAQEVQQAMEGQPFLGSIIKRNVRPEITDAEGNVLAPEEEFYGIAEGNMIAVLTAALQEALGRIDDLEATVATLQS